MFRHDLDSPVGRLILLADDTGLAAVLYPGHRGDALTGDARIDPAPFADVVAQLEEYFAGDRREGQPGQDRDRVEAQLEEYFAGDRREFTVPIAPRGSAFQLAAWSELRRIPYGETRSYGAVAAAVGAPGAARAVGHANNRNPISIIVPCHRVIGSTGSLIGYGGGLAAKQFLLALESRDRALF